MNESNSANPGEPTAARPQGLRCPACRAQQPLQATCRRCGADLRLLVAALRRARFLASQIVDAEQAGEHARAAQLNVQLQQLTPAGISASQERR